MSIVHACTMIIVQACTVIIVYACTMIIVHAMYYSHARRRLSPSNCVSVFRFSLAGTAILASRQTTNTTCQGKPPLPLACCEDEDELPEGCCVGPEPLPTLCNSGLQNPPSCQPGGGARLGHPVTVRARRDRARVPLRAGAVAAAEGSSRPAAVPRDVGVGQVLAIAARAASSSRRFCGKTTCCGCRKRHPKVGASAFPIRLFAFAAEQKKTRIVCGGFGR